MITYLNEEKKQKFDRHDILSCENDLQFSPNDQFDIETLKV